MSHTSIRALYLMHIIMGVSHTSIRALYTKIMINLCSKESVSCYMCICMCQTNLLDDGVEGTLPIRFDSFYMYVRINVWNWNPTYIVCAYTKL